MTENGKGDGGIDILLAVSNNAEAEATRLEVEADGLETKARDKRTRARKLRSLLAVLEGSEAPVHRSIPVEPCGKDLGVVGTQEWR